MATPSEGTFCREKGRARGLRSMPREQAGLRAALEPSPQYSLWADPHNQVLEALAQEVALGHLGGLVRDVADQGRLAGAGVADELVLGRPGLA
eukprot:3629218-Alexandrium_andersonii.AAC.1